MTRLRGRRATPPDLLAAIPTATDHLVSPFPAPVYPIDVTGGITNFGMMGNDVYGDCGPVGGVHLEMTTAAASGTTGPAPDSSLAVQRYVAFTGVSTPPGPGVDLGSYLLWCYKQGIVKAFGKLPMDKATIDGALACGFGVYVGVNLTDDAEQIFDQGEGQAFAARPAWTVANGEQPDPNDGHCVVKAAADGSGVDGYITWGEVVPATEEWTAACLDEAYLVVTTEEQLAKFEPSLLAAVDALRGTGGETAPVDPPSPPVSPVEPTPAPAPVPVPPVPPVPPEGPPAGAPPEHHAWWADIADWYERAVDWVEQHVEGRAV